MQIKILKSNLIIENLYEFCLSLKNYEIVSVFFSKSMLYLMEPILKLFEY
jgi:hypothetical protein